MYVVSGDSPSSVCSVMLLTTIRFFSPMSILYAIISLPLQLGSFHVSAMVVAAAEYRIETTGAGLEEGVTHVTGELKGPLPALLIAWVEQKLESKTGVFGMSQIYGIASFKCIRCSTIYRKRSNKDILLILNYLIAK